MAKGGRASERVVENRSRTIFLELANIVLLTCLRLSVDS
jgi:hypothetical protein